MAAVPWRTTRAKASAVQVGQGGLASARFAFSKLSVCHLDPLHEPIHAGLGNVECAQPLDQSLLLHQALDEQHTNELAVLLTEGRLEHPP